MATVVVVLSGTRSLSSMPSEAVVMASSVSSGGISESVRTMVVLPTPNPPAITILSGTGRLSACTESLQQSLEDLRRGAACRSVGGCLRSVHLEVSGLGQVADEHPGHPDRHPQRGT